MEHPEASDPIYQDFMAEAGRYEKSAAEEQAIIEDLAKEQEKVPARDVRLKKIPAEKNARQKRVEKFKEAAHFYQLRADSRKQFDQNDYLRAYAKKKPWPDPAEIEQYKTIKRLNAASRVWSARVPKPKLSSDSKSAPKEAEAKPAAEGKHE